MLHETLTTSGTPESHSGGNAPKLFLETVFISNEVIQPAFNPLWRIAAKS